MKNSGLRLAVIVVALYAAFTGIIFTMVVDESSYPGAEKIRATGNTFSTDGESLANVVDHLASSANAVILRQVRDLNDPTTRHAFLSSGDSALAESKWVTEGYPAFSQSISTVIHPSSELDGVDPRGEYFVYGSQEATEIVADGLKQLGLSVDVGSKGTDVISALKWFLSGSIGSTTCVTVLLITMLAGLSVINNVKFYSILRLNGNAKSYALRADYRHASLFTALTLVSTVVVGTAGLFFYNSLNQFSMVALNFAMVFGVGIALIALIHALAVSLVWSTNMLEGIKGRLGFRVAVPAAYLIRLPGLILAVSLVASSFVAAQATIAAGVAHKDMSRAGNSASILFGSDISQDEVEKLSLATGKWLKEQDGLGRLIATIPITTNDAEGTTPNALVVNNTYISQNQIVDAQGQNVSVAPATGAKILVPENLQLSKDEELALVEQGGSRHSTLAKNLTVETIKSGQELFLYEPRPDGSGRPKSLSNLPVVVFGPDSNLISDDDFMAYASQGRILVKDYVDATEHTPQEFLGRWIASYIPLAQTSADEYATNVIELRLKVANALIAVLVLMTTAVGLAQIHVRANAKAILVRYLHGWKFFPTHKWLIQSEFALIGIVILWVVGTTAYRYFDLLTSNKSVSAQVEASALSMWQPWVLFSVGLINLCVLLLAVAVRTRLIIRTQSQESA